MLLCVHKIPFVPRIGYDKLRKHEPLGQHRYQASSEDGDL